MYVKNIFRMKDWKIEEFLIPIILVQVIFFSSIFLAYFGLDFPILGPLAGFLLVLFVPGTLILRLLNLEGLESNGQILLYTLGLSLVILMLIGFMMNSIYPIFGIDKPLSFNSTITTINIFIISLCLLCYLAERRRKNKLLLRTLKERVIKKEAPHLVDLRNLLLTPILFPFLIPILSILGAYTMNVYGSNALTILMIFLIGFVAFLTSMGRFIPVKLYPLLIFIISISLLFHKSLITNYIWGWDINYEYFLANHVISNSFWNENLPVSYNSMLSVMILAPILSNFINIGLVWIMKIVYPFLFSLAPLGLYYVFNKQTSPKIAFFSVFFFIIQFTFYTEMLTLIRQQIAEFMLVLILILIISEGINTTKRSFLAVLFGMSIIVAHYGLSYIFMIILLLGALFMYLFDKNLTSGFFKYQINFNRLKALTTLLKSIIPSFKGNFRVKVPSVSKRFELSNDRELMVIERIEKYQSIRKSKEIITSSFIILFTLFLLIWYIYTSNSTIFQSFMDIGRSIVENLYSFMDPNATQGLSLVMEEQVTPLRKLHKNFYLISQFFISIGIMVLFLGKDGMKFNKEFKAMSLAAFIVLVAGVFLPFFSSQMNTSRLYHVALIFLAPFCVLGIIKIINSLKWIFRLILGVNLNKNHLFKFISVFFIVFLFFDTGLVYYFMDSEHPTSIALNTSYDFPKFNQKEVTAGEWLKNRQFNNYTAFADKYRSSVLVSFFTPCKEIPPYFDLVSNQSYIFLGSINVAQGQVRVYQMVGSNIVTSEGYQSSQEILLKRSRIYDNGGSHIYGEVNPNLG